jgi:hypothetical protein
MRVAASAILLALSVSSFASAQDQDTGEIHQRIWGFIPNYLTSPTLDPYVPLTARQKWSLMGEDALDRGTFMTAAGLAGYAQLRDNTPEFGTGFPAYMKYFAASTTDLMVGDLMTEAVLPTILREDPRYFRSGKGSGMKRIGVAIGQIFWTHTDSGGSRFNFSEVGGNLAAAYVSDLYYPGTHTFSGHLSQLALQLAIDSGSNLIKEFSPDLDRWVTRRHKAKQAEHRPPSP